jgi:serine phosphatase RsbU (regulator of sigma subunit)
VLRVGAMSVVVLAAVIMLWNARSRTRLGVAGTRGEAMLIDLRDRLRSQGELPELPRAWYAEAVMRSAGGASFAGDFLVAAKSPDGHRLEVAVVDVSGKGLGAGTRALLLSGAFGGLIGSVPPAEFLPAANAYLLRQEWGEGFATAVYLMLDLRTGEFEVRTAGHPPAAQLHAGSGRWVVQATEGPVLGLIPHAEFSVARGRVLRGDALLLYTDGLVETPQRDISLGIDKLLGEAERLATRGFDRGASRLVDRIASQNDDRALVLLHRQAMG